MRRHVVADQLRPIFEIFLDDSRYAVPTLHLVPADDAAAARQIAQRLIEESEHHLGAEICFQGVRLAALGAFADRPRRRVDQVGGLKLGLDPA